VKALGTGLLLGALCCYAVGQDALQPDPSQGQPVNPTAPPRGRPLGGGAITAPPADATLNLAAPADSGAAPGEEPKPPVKWSWGGQYRIEPDSSNFDFHPLFIGDTQHTQSFVSQRMRVWAMVNPTDNIEGYLQMQIGGVLWGQNLDFQKTFNGPKFPFAEDRVGIMLRRGWLAWQDEDCGKVRAGILDWHDSFGDTLASADYEFDIGGVDWTKVWKDLNNLKVVLATLYLSDLPLITTETVPLGTHTAWLFTADVDQPIGEKSSVGGSVYYLPDRGDYSYPTTFPYRSAYDVWLGVRGKTVVLNDVPLNAFAILNTGERKDQFGATVFRHTGWAGKFEAGPLPLGPGKLSAQTLYASGSSHPNEGSTGQFQTVAQSYHDGFGAQGYWSYLQLTTPNGPSDVQDLGISLQNRGLGLFTVQAKYEYPICGKLSGTSAVGWLRSQAKNPASGSADIGTELAQLFTYNFGHGLTLDLGAAVLFTGDFYREGPDGPSPNDLWEAFGRFQLEF
jgi:hypothetical protein